MVAGITGAIWGLRPAEVNCATLHSGAHAVPIVAASTAWGGLSAAWAEAGATVARVMAELGIGMEGINGVAALSKLTGFLGWAGQQTTMAATMSAKTAANATAYGVAALVMPSPPEIGATNAAVAAAHTPPGIVSGSFAAAEAARVAMDTRAALVMETYEAATTALVTTPGEFLTPPPVAAGAGSAQGGESATMQATPSDPLQATIAAAQGLASNPSVVSAATQAAQSAASMAGTGVTTAGNVAGTAISSAFNGSTGVPSFAGPMMASVGAVGGTAAATRAVSFSGGSVGIGSNAGSLKLPDGWGAGAAIGGGPAATTATAEATAASQAGAPPARTNNAMGNPLLGNQAHNDEEEDERSGNDYLRGEHFAEGGVIAPGVIGADASAESTR
ncbi:PPE domain-containing protein [Nocardia mexicana]|uniref:PPE family protein n=1 Tax=Nocardia mexicana TaxID=279262 RepID=A0A370H2V2_9NOCA|nr:PPE domain-containing protein [Nocardia mexicana]RDI48403.1 PPE family protein [Nocardia mexicana]